MQGYKPIFITAGKNKVPYDAEGAFTEVFLSKIQASVDKLYEKFCEHIASYSTMSVAAIKNTNADMFDADTAVTMGLITSTMTHVEFIDYIVTQLPEGTYTNV
jgi:ClpP class serine protease